MEYQQNNVNTNPQLGTTNTFNPPTLANTPVKIQECEPGCKHPDHSCKLF